jgi:protocatechuate 3,4-dioxygenase beta subunit
MCTANDAEAKAHNWFRGSQVTDAKGRVDFNTCFPGWYSGRTIHIHFRIQRGSDVYDISQLFFEQALITEIFGSHPEYKGYGQPNTSNSKCYFLSKLNQL